MIRTGLITLGFAILATASASASPLNDLEAACAAEAASVFEPGFGTIGRAMNDIDAQRAVDVCWAAMGTGKNDFRMNAWMARAYYAVGQYADAFTFAERAAENEVPLGLYIAGVLYSNGDGVTRDPGKGSDLLIAAADSGFVPAYHALAINLINGTGVDTDPELAVEFLEYAADEGYGPAATTLGHMYFDGIGVAKNDAESHRLLRLAAHYNDADGLQTLGWYTEQGIATAPDPVAAADLYWRAVEQGSEQALLNLAGMYVEGRGVAQDDEMAAELLAHAAALGNEDALAIMNMIEKS